MNKVLSDRAATAASPRVKLRPDAHYAPAGNGVYWSRPGGRSFVLTGPATLYPLIDSRLELLTAGTSVDALVDSVGDEAARPVYTHIIRTLLAQDMLFDLEAAGPAPDVATAARYGDVLGYLESRSDRPYAAFARVRAARVDVMGAGPAAASLIRGLAGYGVADAGIRGTSGRPPALTVLVDDADERLNLEAAAASLPAGTVVLPVLAADGLAMVGAAVADQAGLSRFAGAAARVAGWLRADRVAPAPRPLSAVLAGSLAARAVLDELAGLAGPASATVVYGGVLECQRVPLPAPQDGPRWRDLPPGVSDLPAGVSGLPADPLPEREDDQDQAREQLAWLTARWSGLARWGDDLDLPQLPVTLATVLDVGALPVPASWLPATESGPMPAAPHPGAVLGWGGDRKAAGLDAALSALRDVASRCLPAEPGWVAAAGLTGRQFLVDGLLRLLAAEWLDRDPSRELALDDAGSWLGRSLWNVLSDYFAVPVRLWLREVPGLSWPLVTATGEDGTALAHQWGPSLVTAVYAALAATAASCQLAEDPSATARLESAGSWAVHGATAAQLGQCRDELLTLAAVNDRKVTRRLLVSDPVAGPLPVYAGLVGW